MLEQPKPFYAVSYTADTLIFSFSDSQARIRIFPMMKLLAGVEEVSDQNDKQQNDDQSHNNNHEKQPKTDIAQETVKLLTGEVN